MMITVPRIELDLVNDAIAEIERIHRALASRHGAAFRALDKRIETLHETIHFTEARKLDGEVIVMIPPVAWTAVIADAKRLGV